MSFDAERHNQNLARWATEDLTWFGLKGWQRNAGGSGSGTSWTEGGVQRMVRMSVTAGFQDAEGHWIGVTSHRHDDDGFARLRQWAPLNASMAADRAAGQDPGGQRRRRPPRQRPESTEVEWQEAAILVDGEATPFEVCHLEGGFWAAVGRAPGADLTMLATTSGVQATICTG